MPPQRYAVRNADADLEKFFNDAANLGTNVNATRYHVTDIPKNAAEGHVTFSLGDTEFAHDVSSQLIEAEKFLYHVSTWSRNPNKAFDLAAEVVRAVSEFPPFRYIDYLRSALKIRLDAGTPAQGTPTVLLATLNSLNTDLDGASRDTVMDRIGDTYDLMRAIDDDLTNIGAATAQMWIDALGTLRTHTGTLGFTLMCTGMQDSPRQGLYELGIFEELVTIEYNRSDQ